MHLQFLVITVVLKNEKGLSSPFLWIKTLVENVNGIDDGYLKTANNRLFRTAKVVFFDNMSKKSAKKAVILQPKKAKNGN